MKLPSCKPVARRGFTLIEVMAAIAVLVITLPVLVQGFNMAANLASMTRERAEATGIAQHHMDELVATGDWQGGTMSGEEQSNTTTYQWQATLTDWEEVNTQQLALSVTWNHRGQKRQVVLTTLVYQPLSTVQTGGL